MAMTSAFMEGIDLVEAECLKSVIARMCSEKDPTNCHRVLLVGHYLHNLGYDVRHILPGQPDSESPTTLLERLMRRHRLDDPEQAVDAHQPRPPTSGETDQPQGKTQTLSGTTRINFRSKPSLPPIPMQSPPQSITGTSGDCASPPGFC